MRRFNYEKRRQLEEYIQKRVTITRIAKGFGIARETVYRELKLGLDKENLELKNYSTYSADLAQKTAENRALKKVR